MAQNLLDEGLARGCKKLHSNGHPTAVWAVGPEGYVYRATQSVGDGTRFHGFPELLERERHIPKEIKQILKSWADSLNVELRFVS